MKKKILSTLLISSIVFTATALPLVANADTIDSKIESQTSKINDLQNQESAATSQLASIQNNISSIKAEAEALQTKQVELNETIGTLNDEVSALEKRIEKRDASIKEQARSVQVDSNSSNVVELVLNSDSVSDAVTKVMAASKLVNANNDLMKQQKEDKVAVEDKKAETEEKAEEVKENAIALESKKGELVDQELAQQAQVAAISAEKETEESKKADLVNEKAEIEAQREAQRKAAEEAEAAAKAAAEQAAQEVAQTIETPTVTPDTNTGNTTPDTNTGNTTPDTNVGNTTPDTNVGNTTPDVPKQEEVVKPTTPTPAPPASSNGSAVVAEAYKHIGKPYVWGAKGPDSFDCSGFTSYVYRMSTGREIGGWTVPQESAGTKISISQLQPGDLVFWGPAGATYHVGIYVGDGQYIHAPTTGQTVKVQSISGYTPDFGVRM